MREALLLIMVLIMREERNEGMDYILMRRLSSSHVPSTDAARAQLWTHCKQAWMTLRAASSKAPTTGPTSPSPTGPR